MKLKKRYLVYLLILIVFGFILFGSRKISVTVDKKNTLISSSNVVVSVLGDSISTYEGYSYTDNGSWYYGPVGSSTITVPERTFANGVNETWWMRFINTKGFRLGSNASYGGSLVTNISNTNPYNGISIPSFNNENRLKKLSENGIPDFIFVFGGMNDLINLVGNDGGRVNIGDGSATNMASDQNFAGAYNQLLIKLKKMYPNTKIITLVPFNYGNNTRGGYDYVSSYIRNISAVNGIEYIDLGETVLNGSTSLAYMVYDNPYYIHPNTYGMEVIKEKIISSSIDFSVNGVDVPTCNKVYNGSTQTLVPSNSGYSISGNNSATNQGTYNVYLTPNMGYQWNDGTRKDTKLVSCTISKKNIANITISNIADQTYTAGEIKPSITVTLDGKTLTNGSDYSLSYKNNINVGEATIVIQGTGNYTGTISKTFRITSKSINGASISNVADQTYTTGEIKPSITVTLDGKTLTNGSDYSLSYKNNINVGEATIVIQGTGNYTGTVSKTFRITSKSINGASISNVANQTYTTGEIKPSITVTLDGKTLTNGSDYSLSYKNNINVGNATITIQGIGNYTGSVTKTFKIIGKSISETEISNIADQTYTAGEIKPPVTITLNGKTLTNGSDYSLSYKNNINIGEATIIIEGIGNYTGTIDKKFKIVPIDISNAVISNIADQTYTKGEIKPSITVTLDGKTLTNGSDYSLSYKNNIDVGEATIIIKGIGIYSGNLTKKFKIIGKSIKNVEVEEIIDQTYTSSMITPTPLIKLGNEVLEQNKDYSLSYKNNTNVGEATIIIEGIGNYSESVSKNFKIVSKSIDKAEVSGINDQTYTSSMITPTPVIKLDNKVLVKDKDYNLSYKNNINVGEATIIIQGIGNYKESVTKTFRINKLDISKVDIGNILAQEYTGSIIEPKLEIKLDNKILEQDKDYSLSYKNNVNIGEATVIIKGIGNYTGSISKTFKIVEKDIKNVEISNIIDQEYKGEEIKPKLTIKIGNKILEQDKDYSLSYKNNINVGEATVTIKGIGNYIGSVSKNYKIIGKNIKNIEVEEIENQTYTSSMITPTPVIKLDNKVLVKDKDYNLSYKNNINVGEATIIIEGIGNYIGSISKNYKITEENISNVEVEEIEEQIYTASLVEPKLVIKFNNKILKQNEDYSLEYKNNINIGDAFVTISGIKNFKGTLNKTFKIIPLSSKKFLKNLKVNDEDILSTLTKKVPASTVKVNITAELEAEDSTIMGLGEKELKDIINTYEIIVIDKNKSKRIYTVVIIKEQDDLIDKERSNNNFLSSLNVKNYKITPEFKKDIYEYYLEVENNIDKIDIEATLEDSKAKIIGIGEKILNAKNNIFEITVVAEDNTIQKYLLNVKKKEKNNEDLKQDDLNNDSTNKNNSTSKNNSKNNNIKNPETRVSSVGFKIIILEIVIVFLLKRFKKKQYIIK